MQVKLKTTMCGPNGSFQAGQKIDVDASVGKELVSGGYAAMVDEGEVKSKLNVKPAKIEEAMAKPAEKATIRKRAANKG